MTTDLRQTGGCLSFHPSSTCVPNLPPGESAEGGRGSRRPTGVREDSVPVRTKNEDGYNNELNKTHPQKLLSLHTLHAANRPYHAQGKVGEGSGVLTRMRGKRIVASVRCPEVVKIPLFVSKKKRKIIKRREYKKKKKHI
jgi:hypothetical protein